MNRSLPVLLQYAIPKTALTLAVGWLASKNMGRLTARLITAFCQRYGVNMDEALLPDPARYENFNEFFSRALKPGARPLDEADYVCPVDGGISQYGAIHDGQIFQAKGHAYSVEALIGGDPLLAETFRQGSFANLYLSPRDYHRIHMPCDGRLVSMTHVPGTLFSVSPACAEGIPGLFARNERVVCVFETGRGPMIMVLVGATIVGSIGTVWHGIVNAQRPAEPRQWRYEPHSIVLRQGEEMGRFMMGSTVIVLFADRDLDFNPAWQPAGVVRLGQRMATASRR